MAAPQKIDWERIEPDFRAGIKSVLQIAAEYEAATGVSVSHTAINKHFKGLGVTRDLTAKVLAKAKAIVSASMVSGKVSVETTATDAEIINKSAIDIAIVEITHRKDIGQARKLAMTLLNELEHQTENIELYEQLGELLHTSDEKGLNKLNEIYRKSMTLSSRSGTMKQLSDTLKTLIGLEREAFGLESVREAESTTVTRVEIVALQP